MLLHNQIPARSSEMDMCFFFFFLQYVLYCIEISLICPKIRKYLNRIAKKKCQHNNLIKLWKNQLIKHRLFVIFWTISSICPGLGEWQHALRSFHRFLEHISQVKLHLVFLARLTLKQLFSPGLLPNNY